MRILVLGAPGVGKGSQASRMAKALSIPHIATGDLFREQIAHKTDIGRKVRAFIHQGMLVPDDITIDLLFHRLSGADSRSGFVLDGFPRTLTQAERLDELLCEMNLYLDVVVNISLNDSSIARRIIGRRTCSQCGMIYHIEDYPPETEGICNYCLGALFQRTDDSLEVIEQRLQIYHDQTRPLIEHYQNMPAVKFVQIESDKEINVTTRKLFKALGISTNTEDKNSHADTAC